MASGVTVEEVDLTLWYAWQTVNAGKLVSTLSVLNTDKSGQAFGSGAGLEWTKSMQFPLVMVANQSKLKADIGFSTRCAFTRVG